MKWRGNSSPARETVKGGKSLFDTPSTKSLPSALNTVHIEEYPIRPADTVHFSKALLARPIPADSAKSQAQLPRCIHLPGTCVYGGVFWSGSPQDPIFTKLRAKSQQPAAADAISLPTHAYDIRQDGHLPEWRSSCASSR